MSLRRWAGQALMAGAVVLGAATAAQAQSAGEDAAFMHAAPAQGRDTPGRRGRPSTGNPLEVSEGARLLKAAGIACQPIDGVMLSQSGRQSAYEIACKDDFGWTIAKGAGGETVAFDCLVVAGSTKGARHCILPANRAQLKGLQALADKARTGCTVTDGVWLGSGGKPPIRRYETTCKGGGGYIFDVAEPCSEAGLSATACKDAEAFGMKCGLPARP